MSQTELDYFTTKLELKDEEMANILAERAMVNDQAECERDLKHVLIWHAIHQLDDIINHGNDLLCTITGEDLPKETEPIPDTKPRRPTLLEVLDTTPDTLRTKCSVVHDILNKIREAIM